MALDIWLRAFCMLGNHSITELLPSPFYFLFWDEVFSVCRCCPWTSNPRISDSWVSGITGAHCIWQPVAFSFSVTVQFRLQCHRAESNRCKPNIPSLLPVPLSFPGSMLFVTVSSPFQKHSMTSIPATLLSSNWSAFWFFSWHGNHIPHFELLEILTVCLLSIILQSQLLHPACPGHAADFFLSC